MVSVNGPILKLFSRNNQKPSREIYFIAAFENLKMISGWNVTGQIPEKLQNIWKIKKKKFRTAIWKKKKKFDFTKRAEVTDWTVKSHHGTKHNIG